MKKQTSRISAIMAALILGCSLWAASALAAGPGTVTMTVTVAGKKETNPPVVTKDDVELFLNKQRTQVGHWQHAEKLYLAVLIDDSLRSETANQWNDLKAFLTNQPDTTYVLVGYIRNGSVAVAQDFTNDHGLAAKALRIPLGGGGAFSSPYLALQDLMKRLPDATASDRRSILLISSGIDYFRGEFELVDPDLDSTISRAQKDNINIWSIYAPDAGHRGRGFFVATRAQSNLSQLSGETGGEAFYLSTSEPVSLKPYFDELTMHLNNQYLLTFNASGGEKGRFERTRVHTELQYAEFMAASQAFLPADK